MSAIDAQSTEAHPPAHRHGWWWKMLLAGTALWVITAVVTIFTRNSNLIPTIILLGSFLVPLTVMLFAAERVPGNVTATGLMLAFFVGGIFGVLGASLLEAPLHQSFFGLIAVGFIEEFVKAVILVVVGWRVRPKTGYQGALLGATVGAGFAAFESAGYAFNAAVTAQGLDLLSLLQTETLRAVLTPVGHVLWTAILGAALFSAAHGGNRYRLSGRVIGAYVIVSVLHALWDSMGPLSTLLAILLTGVNISVPVASPAQAQAIGTISTTSYIAGLVLVSILGILVLRVWARRGRPAQRTPVVVPAGPGETASHDLELGRGRYPSE
jgi:RsiW-degrading membrane proteinase PrsW (M82 family)